MRILRFTDFLREDLAGQLSGTRTAGAIAYSSKAPHGVSPVDDIRDIQKLNKKLKQIDDRHMDINHGGCGAFAVIMYDLIVAEFGVTPEILVELEEWDDDLSINYIPDLKDLDDLHKKSRMSINHIVILLDNWVIDSEGVRPRSDEWQLRQHNVHELGVDQLRKWVDAGGWNDTFDTKEIPKIKKEAERAIKAVGKQIVKRHVSDERAKDAVDKAVEDLK